jgi:thioredoxin-related protein
VKAVLLTPLVLDGGVDRGTVTRRACLQSLALGAGLAALSLPAEASGFGLPRVDDLQRAIQNAQAKSMPVVVMVTLEGCPYCKIVRQNYLPEYLDKGVPILELNLSASDRIRDEQGQPTSCRDWANAKNIRIAPTLVWLGKGGQELVSRLPGMSSRDFYGAYLDDRMQQAIKLSQA